MKITYCIKKNLICGEDGKEHVVYGVEAINSDKETVMSFSDIFFELEEAESFIELCNRKELSLVHFGDVTEDALAKQYSIL